ncbi:MAG: glycosyltransferase family 39 protein [Anaerolineales bacterium]|nr:glycosyltransferase family 39 protein [Anaerolineales bacterium]MBX3038106.1 glycosyltransferase family 39 protein [Anaerolineales bacterium]
MTKKTLTQSEWIILILGIAFVGGVFIRFFPTLIVGFPINDGGMFLSMVRDLTASNYFLPKFTSYNQLQIPYAYPPFGFYFARIISDIFSISEINLLRFIPPFVNSLSIFAFYLLSSELLKSKSLGALSSAFYALTPGAYGWFVMGGGLTRSFGSLFLLLTVFVIYKLYQTGAKKYIGLGIAWGGLAVLSHPEAGIHTAATCILLWIIFGRTRQSFINSIFVAFGVLLFTSPWWLTVISYHGLNPFLSASHTGSFGVPFFVGVTKAIVGEGLIPVLVLLKIIGLILAVYKKRYFLLIWVFLPYLIEPRSAPSVTFYPLTMLIALAFAEAIPFFFSRLQKINVEEIYKNKIYNFILLFVLVILFIDSSLYSFRLIGNSLKSAEIESMMWIKENISPDAKIISLTGNPSPEIDPFIEWLPALSERRNQSTIQGYEWLLGEKFFERYSDLAELQNCETVTCVEEWSLRTELDFQFIVINQINESDSVNLSFADSENYQQIYKNDEVTVYQR